MSVLGIHVDLCDSRLLTLVDLDQRGRQIRRQSVDQDVRCLGGEVELLDEVAGGLLENRLAPMDVEYSQFRGVDDVVAQCPRDQYVRVGESDRQVQSRFPYLFARSATTAIWSSSRNSRIFWIDEAGMR